MEEGIGTRFSVRRLARGLATKITPLNKSRSGQEDNLAHPRGCRRAICLSMMEGELKGFSAWLFVMKALLPRRSQVGFMRLASEQPLRTGLFEPQLMPKSPDTMALRSEMFRTNR